MDNTPKNNPLVNPPDTVLKAAIHLDTDVSFNEIRKWLDSCLSHAQGRLPFGKDDVEYRWVQGQVQALSQIMDSLSNPRVKLMARAKEAAENVLPRNF
jgi:hypothetical protein